MVALGCDHGGFDLKQHVIRHLEERGIAYKDFGCFDKTSCDYPQFGRAAAKAVASGECEKGIVICTTGIGISITANKIPLSARMTRLHNDANVLALGGALIGPNMAFEIVDTFLDTEFSSEEKHIRRVEQIEQ